MKTRNGFVSNSSSSSFIFSATKSELNTIDVKKKCDIKLEICDYKNFYIPVKYNKNRLNVINHFEEILLKYFCMDFDLLLKIRSSFKNNKNFNIIELSEREDDEFSYLIYNNTKLNLNYRDIKYIILNNKRFKFLHRSRSS